MQSCYYMQLRIVAYNLAVMNFFKSCLPYEDLIESFLQKSHKLVVPVAPLAC